MSHNVVKTPPTAVPLPALQKLDHGISLLHPLTRKGTGPGLIILTTASTTDGGTTTTDKSPSPLVKWAEEGFAVTQIPHTTLETVPTEEALELAIKSLDGCSKSEPKDKVGLIAYSAGLWNKTSSALEKYPAVLASVVYVDDTDIASLSSSSKPTLLHIAGATKTSAQKTSAPVDYRYPSVKSHNFVSPTHQHFHYNAETIAHTRTLQFLKTRMNGPWFDLEAIWEEHTSYEFESRNVDHVMSTMVPEPYVNHVPVLTGGIGGTDLANFYRHHFIFNNSVDTEMELISRTVGIDRVVDEFIFSFTHDSYLDWLLPGVPPTNLKAQVPFTAIVNIRGDRLYHEHISWDQGTVLRQLGLMPDYLPFPYKVDGREGKWEYKVPVTGVDVANKMKDRNAVKSNEMFVNRARKSETTVEYESKGYY